MQTKITTLFLDIGGVLLSNGWGRDARHEAVRQFKLEFDEIDERHHLTYDTYEAGKLTLNEYLDRVIFYKKQDFSREDFVSFMFSYSKANHEMIALVQEIVDSYNLKTLAVNNEGKELNEYRIKTFKLDSLIHTFVSSCYVHLRKPDKQIFKLALDISQSKSDQVLYIDDRKMFVEVAETFGIRGIHHIDIDKTRIELERYGLKLQEQKKVV